MVLAELARSLPSFHCYALDLRAHGCSRASSSWDGEWAGFASDLLTVVAGLGLEGCYAFGHSCGGASLLLAEEAAPGTFRHLYCFEPVVMPSLDPPLPSFDNPLAVGAARRRERFASRREALENYASKAPLSLVQPEVLAAYVEHGFSSEPDGSVVLRGHPADEARIFAYGACHTAFANLDKVACPVELACGALSDSFGRERLEVVGDRLRDTGGDVRMTVFDGLGHLGPMEQPAIVAAAMATAFSTSMNGDRALPTSSPAGNAGQSNLEIPYSNTV